LELNLELDKQYPRSKQARAQHDTGE